MNVHSHTFKAMGSPCEIKLYVENDPSAIFYTLEQEVFRLEKKYTRYAEESVTSAINRQAGKLEATTIDAETAGLLNYADQLYQQSDALFDITSGILRKVWDFKSNILPTPEQLVQVLPNIGWENVELTEYSIRLCRKNMEIDFGGFVKEYATDAVSVMAKDLGVRHGLVNLGGDLRVIGPHPDGAPWRIGIQHPRQANTAISMIEVFEGALATSGDYERFMLVDGKRYSHLLNPKTGQSIQPAFCSVSIVAEACLIAGSFSTIALLKSVTEPEWLQDCGLPYLSFDQDLRPSGSIGCSV